MVTPDSMCMMAVIPFHKYHCINHPHITLCDAYIFNGHILKLHTACNPHWACSPDVGTLQMVGWSNDPLANKSPISWCLNTGTHSL
jgi:hypothetical protein